MEQLHYHISITSLICEDWVLTRAARTVCETHNLTSPSTQMYLYPLTILVFCCIS
jgi:hypothetical protein